jgi:hypothetical protein
LKFLFSAQFLKSERQLVDVPGVERPIDLLDDFSLPISVYRFVDAPTLGKWWPPYAASGNSQLLAQQFLQLAAQLFETISLLHETELAHGDIKPGNILIERGSPILIDGVFVRVSGLQIGTPAYLSALAESPFEQDLYAFWRCLEDVLKGSDTSHADMGLTLTVDGDLGKAVEARHRTDMATLLAIDWLPRHCAEGILFGLACKFPEAFDRFFAQSDR